MTNATPLISIIIPTFNRAQLLGETLDSVLGQTYKNWECIVVDDGSTDNTEMLMVAYKAKDSRFKYYRRPDNLLPGGNAARNYGFEISQGEYVNWFDDDDIMLPEFLEIKAEAIKPERDLIICTGSFWNPISNSQRKKNLQLTTNLYQDFLCWRLKILTPSVLFRSTFLKNRELFSSGILRGQESEFFLRIFHELPKNSFAIINKSLFLYRQHEENKTTEDSEYVPRFREGRYLLYFTNYIRLQGTGEKESIDFCYHQILNIFYDSVNYQHLPLSRKILQEFFPLLKQRNFLRGIEMIFIGNLFVFFNRSSYKLIGRWKKFRH